MASSAARAMWAAVVPRVRPDQRAAGLRIPVRRAEPGEGRHEDDAAGVRHAGGERLDVGGLADEAEPVAQPLHGGAGDEDAAFEGVFARFAGLRRTVVIRPLRESTGRVPVCISRKQPVP